MALISNAIPNLWGGVSQQPPALRAASSCAAQENAWPSVVSGLMKRQPTEFIKTLNLSVSNGAMVYVIDRDASYRYMAIITNNDLKVYDLEGNEQTVNFPNGKSYLTSAYNPVDAFRFMTLGDTSFVLNREVVVRARNYGEAGTASSFSPDGTVENIADLPMTNAPHPDGSAYYGDVYFVENEGDYYVGTRTKFVAPFNEWQATTSWQNTVPAGFTFATNLPSRVTLGSKVYIARIQNKTLQYRGYTGVANAGSPGGLSWVETPLSRLTTVTTNRFDPDEMATVHVTQSVPNAVYAVYINGTLRASFTTKNNMDGNNAVEPTTKIALELHNALGSAGYTTNIYGSTVSIRGLASTDKVETWTTNGDKSLKAYRESVASFSDLPPNERIGRIVKIKGDPTEKRDDYYVVYNDKKEWDECEGFNQGAELRPETMPHVLVREADGTWTFKRHEWDARTAGDSDSNPHPSFVGFTMRDIFVYGNRMGFVADENIILSEADDYENFYRTSLAQLLDSDPIDYSVLHSNVNILQHAVPFNNDLILFSDQNQFRFTFDNALNSRNVRINLTTSFNCARRTRPVNMGQSIYFSDDVSTSRYAKVWEYFPKDAKSDDAEEATAPIPEYIPARVRFFAGSTRVSSMVLGTEDDPASLYLYKYFWAGDKKVQNSWGKWKFTDCTSIYWAGFVNNYLYLLMQRSDGLSIERMKFDEDVFTSNTDYEILLDRRFHLSPNSASVSYNADTRISTITLPYSTTATVEVVSSTPPITDGILDSVRQPVTRVNGNTITIPGDMRPLELVIGIPYTFLYEFSTPYLKQGKGSGAGSTVLDGRLQMRYMSLEYHNTAYFTTKVRLPGRPDYSSTFNGRVLGSDQTVLGQATFLTGTFRIPLMGKNTDLRFWLLNDSPFPSTFGSAEWQAMYSPRSVTRT